MNRIGWSTLIMCLAAALPRGEAQTPLPPRWGDLPKLSATWPAEWAAVVRDLPAEDFEAVVLKRIIGLLPDKAPSADELERAETVLAATLRHHLSVRRPPKQALQSELEQRLATVRTAWLARLQKTDTKKASQLADRWLPAASDNELGKAILSLWVAQAEADLAKSDFGAASKKLERIDAHFANAVEADEIRTPLREHAFGLLKNTPGQTLVVAVRGLPEQMSPATAWTEIERQSLSLVFDRLYDVEHHPAFGKRYRPRLATTLPGGGLSASIPLRRDVYFTNGERLTVAYIRATAQLMNLPDALGRSNLWRDYLKEPEIEDDRFQLTLVYEQGLFDPFAALTFWVLPRLKGLDRPDDPQFAKAPVGSGPFQYVGRKDEGDKKIAVFQANPHDVRRGSIAEIRLMAWKDLGKPLPHLILDAPRDQLTALKELGYVERGVKSPGRVTFLAVNHRRASLGSVNVRRAIAHVLDRTDMVNRRFGGGAATSNGLFPRESWANAPSPRVPANLFNLEQARSFAKEARTDVIEIAWTLKYPAGEPRVKAACEEMAAAIGALFRDAGIKADVQAVGLLPAALRKALEERDYDLLYMSEEGLDDPLRLALLFDRQENATRAGGSNFLGYDSDAKLQDLVRAAVQHRQFSAVQENMQAIHVHLYETMPAIPLWQLDVRVLALPSLQTPPLEARAVFDRIREWKVK
jgi:ABC-type transport system substrate-binding protein